MKLRTLPYGYQFTDGVITVHPRERDTVTEICKKRIAKSDEELLREITELLNKVISSPEMIRIPTAADREPCPEVRKLDNEIGRMLEGFNADKDALRKAMLRRVSAAYRDIPNEISSTIPSTN